MMITLIWILVLVAAFLLYCKQTYSYFSRRGVKYLTPVPLLGNMTKAIFRLEHLIDSVQQTYDSFPEERFVGRFELLNPMVHIKDIELIKKITIKDFDHFLDHRTIVSEEADSFFGRSLFSLKGQEWKDMRSTLSPAFTSSKMKMMIPFMVEVGEQMIKSLKQKIKDSGVGYIDIDCKDLTTRYANDVIATCAFGLKVDSMNEVDNQFYSMAKAASTFNFRQILIFFGVMSFPKIMKFLKISLFSMQTKSFFRNLVITAMREREAKNIVRPDMIHLLMQAKKGQLRHDPKSSVDVDAGFSTVEESDVGKQDVDRMWNNNDIAAQAMIFFMAGFEGIASAMSFVLHEVALHPEVQERLVLEIQENERNNNGRFDYNSVQKMTYLDMVVSESFRMWPAAVVMDRVCTKDYNLGKPNAQAENDFILREGMGVGIPVWAFHHDPKYFPDPLKFDPERFSEENNHKIQPFTYMPFGLGPRNCIGSRFALCEIKVMVYQLLQHMEISPCAKTCIPSKLSKDGFNLRLEGGHWNRLKIRQ